ncbi:unnamed protein product [Tuber melanosporum]|uniref:(Perigord truffle) hypothetical protein n=1 Tax=Tuber melanosporum (strain Mel28) TaxID=656061 RepID=D5G9K9_TUBMM|nr:uncharacterized protein GSTUM_00003367001 [Tuber melanosporum]CAZ81202.1 unnamed protein product [Tuber melanosporum]
MKLLEEVLVFRHVRRLRLQNDACAREYRHCCTSIVLYSYLVLAWWARLDKRSPLSTRVSYKYDTVLE